MKHLAITPFDDQDATANDLIALEGVFNKNFIDF